MLIIAPSGMLLWLFSVFCSGSRLSDWLMQCIFIESFLDVFVWEHYICSTLVMFNIDPASIVLDNVAASSHAIAGVLVAFCVNNMLSRCCHCDVSHVLKLDVATPHTIGVGRSEIQ